MHWCVGQTKCCHGPLNSVMQNLCFRPALISGPLSSFVNKPKCGFLILRLSIWNPHSSEGIRRCSSVICHSVINDVTKNSTCVKSKKGSALLWQLVFVESDSLESALWGWCRILFIKIMQRPNCVLNYF